METKTKRRQNTTQQDAAAENAVVIDRVFNLPARIAWLALTDSEYYKKWWGPKGFTCPYSKMEPKPGGRYLNCMRGPDGKEFWSTGIVQEFIPKKKLVVTDSFSDEKRNIKSASEYGMPGEWPRELMVSFELEETNGVTKLRLTHEGIPAEMHDECTQGWNESFDKLEENIK